MRAESWLSVLNSNERAINFYKKSDAGFEKIGNHKEYNSVPMVDFHN